MNFPNNEVVICANRRLRRPANEVAKRYMDACKHWRTVPRERLEHAVWRTKLRLACLNSKAVREKVWDMCASDFVFWASSFCYIVEPRAGEDAQGRFPFIPWTHQIPMMCAMHVEWGRRHLIGNKSRAQGASWIAVMKLAHAFIFGRDQHLGIGSKTESDADDPRRPGSAGWKLDYILASMPDWMRPEGVLIGEPNRSVSSHTWTNTAAGNYIKAEAATKGIGRGSRFTAFVLDEAAHFPNQACEEACHNLMETSNGLVLISTPNGISGDGQEFYRRCKSPGPWLTINLFWWENPSQNRGLYSTNPKTNAPIIHDRKYDFPANYPFVCDNKYRSPWYDRREALHGFNNLLIAQELDGSFTGSVGRPFGEELISRCETFIKKPLHRGQFLYEPTEPRTTGEFLYDANGPLKLWRPLDARRRLPPGSYVVGADIAAGTGGDWSSNSVLSVFDSLTCEQVAEWSSHRVPPTEFADLTAAFCYWLAGSHTELPFLIWERNGSTGTAYTARMIANGYPNVYYAAGGEELRPYAKRSNRPGYWNSRLDYALTPLLNALTSGAVTLRSADCVKECGEYLYDPSGSGKWVHPGASGSLDASAQGLNHGDRVVAAGMAVHGLKDRGHLSKTADFRLHDPDRDPPKHSMAGRYLEAQRRHKEKQAAKSCIW